MLGWPKYRNTWGAARGVVNEPSLGYYLGLGLSYDGTVVEANGFANLIDLSSIKPRRESQIVSPSDFFAFMDSAEVFSQNLWHGMDMACAQLPGPQFIQHPPQHGKYFNVLFSDKHVSTKPLVNLFYTVASGPGPQFTTAAEWNVDHQAHPEFWLME